MMRALVLGLMVVGYAAGCGGSQPADTAGSTPETGTDPQPGAATVKEGAQAAQEGLQQMMQGLQQMAGGEVQVSTRPVDYELLKDVVPEFSGWERSDVKGQQLSMGISVSSAEGRYRQSEASIKLEIIDTSFSQVLLAPFMMLARAGYEQRSDDGYQKGITLAGHPGFESWKKAARDGEVHLLVANRFLINAEGSGVDSTEPVRQLVQAIDLEKLAGLE